MAQATTPCLKSSIQYIIHYDGLAQFWDEAICFFGRFNSTYRVIEKNFVSLFKTYTAMKEFIKQLHIWLSIPLGVIISITCFTGALLVFEREITAVMQEFSVEESAVEESSKPERLEFFKTTLRLHRSLMVVAERGEMNVGKLVVGISTISMVLLLLSGLVLWWPKCVKMLRHRVLINLRKGWHRFWYDMHVSAGFWVTVVLLIMALTGLVWSFAWYRDGFYSLFGSGARAWLRSLHVGSVGGLFTRVVWCVAAIVGGTLPLTGYYLWIKRKFFRRG